MLTGLTRKTFFLFWKVLRSNHRNVKVKIVGLFEKRVFNESEVGGRISTWGFSLKRE